MSIIATSHCFSTKCPYIANSMYPDLCVCLCLTSYQQLRSYGDGATAYVSSDRLVKLGVEPATPGLQGKWFIHYTRLPFLFTRIKLIVFDQLDLDLLLIESILSTEWQCLEIKTDLYKAITLLKCVMLLTLTCRNLSTDI